MEKKKQNVLLLIMGALILVQLVVVMMTLSEYDLFINVVSLIPLLFVAIYGFWLYKKPHGNMLKYAMLIHAVSKILIYISLSKKGFDISYNATVMVFALCILIYVSGRLNCIEQNKYLLPISFMIQFACDLTEVVLYADQFSLVYCCTWFSTSIATLTIVIAYFVRYKEHKEAGLTDK